MERVSSGHEGSRGKEAIRATKLKGEMSCSTLFVIAQVAAQIRTAPPRPR